MNETRIIEGNQLIHEFLGFERTEKDNGEVTYKTSEKDVVLWASKLEYDSSILWLWRALQKWDNLYEEIDPKNGSMYVELSDKLDNTVVCYEVNLIWEQMIENIKWYNKQKL